MHCLLSTDILHAYRCLCVRAGVRQLARLDNPDFVFASRFRELRCAACHVLVVCYILHVVLVTADKQQAPLLAATCYRIHHCCNVALVVLVVCYVFDAVCAVALQDEINKAVGRGVRGFQFGCVIASVLAIGLVLKRTVGWNTHSSNCK